MKSILHWRERALKRGTFPLNESKAPDEELFALKRESLEERNLSAERIKARQLMRRVVGEHFALKSGSLEKGNLSAERNEAADEEHFALEREP